MMGIGKSLVGICVVEITSAAIADILTSLESINVHLSRISYCDELHIRAEVYSFELPRLQKYLSRRGDGIKVLKRKGLFWTLKRLKNRPVFVAGIVSLFLLTLYLPSRVFFVRVEGNEKISTQHIVEMAELCGIRFGADRRQIRSEKMKNALLSFIPELQWAGVNTFGCVAVISVRERTEEIKNNSVPQSSSIIAERDGIIKEMVVIKGNPLCRVGQAVKEGQVLVSGYTDCGLLIKLTPSEAEITAQTQRNLHAVTPVECEIRGDPISEERKYLFRIGKNIINFSKYSGISDTRCVKMYEEKFMELPGGFQLPVSFITERTIYFDNTAVSVNQSEDFVWMESAAETYMRSQMHAGRILNSNTASDLSNGLYAFTSTYSCDELIGVVREEEIVLYNGKTN